jgi:Tfp pilus assembly protein PilE
MAYPNYKGYVQRSRQRQKMRKMVKKQTKMMQKPAVKGGSMPSGGSVKSKKAANTKRTQKYARNKVRHY